MNPRFLGMMLLVLTILAVTAAETPIVIDARKQLFLDDYLIASMKGVKRTVDLFRAAAKEGKIDYERILA